MFQNKEYLEIVDWQIARENNVIIRGRFLAVEIGESVEEGKIIWEIFFDV